MLNFWQVGRNSDENYLILLNWLCIAVYTKACHIILVYVSWNQNTSSHFIFLRFILILFPHLYSMLPNTFFIMLFMDWYIVWIFRFCHPCHVSCIFCLSYLIHCSNSGWRVKIVKPLVNLFQYVVAVSHLVPYLLQQFIPKNPQIIYLNRVRIQV
jgi:hypothetical protein